MNSRERKEREREREREREKEKKRGGEPLEVTRLFAREFNLIISFDR